MYVPHACSAGGWFFGAAPDKKGDDADIFWDPAVYAHVLYARAFPGGSVANSPAYRLSEMSSFRRMLQTSDGAQHLLFKDSGHCLQMHVRGADVTEPVHLLMDIIQHPGMLKHHLSALESFNNFISGQAAKQKHFAADPSSQKLCATLRVLDARLAGASYREIAVSLFGLGRVKEDWNATDEHLKNRIRRAAKRGTFLMEGGYRTLLR